MTFLYRILPIREYCEENFTNELKKLPPSLASYAAAAKEGEARARRLAGMQALAACLAHLSLPAPEIDVSVYGKPYFKTGEQQFNVSHAGELAVAVLAPHRVGVDLEPYDRAISEGTCERILARCSEGERKPFAALCGEGRRRAFLELWVKKEALAKRGGRGLAGLSAADTAATPPAHFESLVHGGREYCLAIY